MHPYKNSCIHTYIHAYIQDREGGDEAHRGRGRQLGGGGAGGVGGRRWPARGGDGAARGGARRRGRDGAATGSGQWQMKTEIS